MRSIIFAFSFMVLPLGAWGEGIRVTDAFSPLAPPNAKVHAAYMSITNGGDEVRQLVGIRADGYGMVHLHHSMKLNGVSTMAPMHQVTIEPGQTISLEPGMMHVMLMHPKARVAMGDEIALMLEFANGESIPVIAIVASRDGNS